MHFFAEQRFEVSADQLVATLTDPAYRSQAPLPAGEFPRTVVRDEEVGGCMEHVVRVQPKIPLPKMVLRLAGLPDPVEYFEHSVEDWAQREVRFWVETPARLKGVVIKGRLFVQPDGDAACTRTLEGICEIALPGVGKQIEAAIVRAIENGFRASNDDVRAWLARPGISSHNNGARR